MSRVVTALYDTRAEAEAAQQRLRSAVDVDQLNVVDQGSSGRGLDRYHLSDDDRHVYGEALRRGGALLCAEVDEDADADAIVRALEETSSVDVDERQRGWQQEGWQPYAGQPQGRAAPTRSAEPVASARPSGGMAGVGGATTAGGGTTIQEERIPIIEEELRVGKREVQRGGARVRSYVREVPVQEDVTLREEHVVVERRPVESQTLRGAGNAGDLLQERTIEMTESVEEAVVEKVATVKEEVVIKKTAEVHNEHVQDTVRRTEVDVQNDLGAQERSASGTSAGGSRPLGGTAR